MTDNPSGSTGQNVTTPISDDALDDMEGQLELAERADLPAPLLRSVIARLRKAEADLRWMVERAADKSLGAYRELGERAANAENARDAAIRERDEARAKATSADESSIKLYSTVLALRAERDALAAKLAEAEREIERARGAHAMLAAAESRAAALAEALREARDMVADWAAYASPYFQEKHDLPGDLAKLDAALAGNGNGTGEGDGWIACETDMNPTPYECVLAIVEGDVVIASYSGPHRSAIDGRMRPLWSTTPRQPTHWRPLPAAPPSAGETT